MLSCVLFVFFQNDTSTNRLRFGLFLVVNTTMFKFIYVLALSWTILSSHQSCGKPFYRSPWAFNTIFDKVTSHLDGRLQGGSCEACKFITDAIQLIFATDLPEDEVTHVLTKLCKTLKVEDDRVCDNIVKLFSPEVLTVFDRVFLSSDEICGTVIGPSCGHIKKDVFWNVTLFNTPKPPVHPVKPPKPGSPTLRVLHFSDIHHDPLYQEGSNPHCGEPLCCRKNDPAPGNSGAGKYGDYQCDNPLSTLENMMQHISKTHKVDYILWTGDIPPHNVWNQTRKDQVAAIDNAVKIILKYLPDVKVFPAVGNHEGSPVDSFPPPFIVDKDSNDWLRDTLADHWKNWLPDYTMSTIQKGGFYSVLLSTGFRIVSLNMNYCNNLNWWLLINDVDPAQQLKWLVDTLQQAEDNGEKVHIIGHIPPGSDDCLKPWSWNYYRIIDRYQSTVVGQFFGHTHNDEFEIFYDEKSQKIPTSIAYIGPAVTTYKGGNPGYRIYEIDGDYANSSRVVLNHETYFLDLVKANEGKPDWKLEYTAKDTYNMSSLLPESWNYLVHRMAKDTTLFNTFYKFFHKSSPSSVHSPCDTSSCREQLLCRLMTGRSYDHSVCNLYGLSTVTAQNKRAFGKTLDFC